MDTKALNKRKSEIIDQQESMLKAAATNKVSLTKAEDEKYESLTSELDSISKDITRFEAIAKGRLEIGTPTTSAVVSTADAKKFYALGGYRKATTLDASKIDEKAFWQSLRSKQSFDSYCIKNAALGEGGTTADGSALVPIETDPTIPAMAIEETICRSLSRVITTEMNLNLPYQSAKAAAAIKAESNNSGTNAFATNVPNFATTELQAYVIGDSMYASWELLEDAKAASQFLTEELQRIIRVKEENYFVNGSGSSQPQGYLGNATTAFGVDAGSGTATLGINPIFDVLSSLNRAYYGNASWLVNRQEFNRLLKKQVAASQFQTYVTWDANGDARLLGYPVAFSAEMPVYSASPSTTGAWLFGDFNRFATIGDRGDSNIRIKVLDQVAALNGQTVVLGYRRTDQRIILAEAVVELQTNG